ncbi:hypothetical protein AB0469_03370 [Streptomyces sp. NPDC093801]|uniref:hypothetical protein n=1 Tax=Streptomyces sp. NPDC093801 TaxID=3155203 RepID=UPI00344DA371
MTPPPRRTLPRPCAYGITLALLTVLGVSACTREEPRPAPSAAAPPALTTPQAELLALTRFTNYRRGTARVSADIPVQGKSARLTGRLDWRHGTGLALLQIDGGPRDQGRHLLSWNRTTVSMRRDWTGSLPARAPRDGWTEHPLTARTSTVDTTLLLLLDLAANRPDNAQLLLRSGARRLGSEQVDGVPVTVFAGPSATPSQDATRESSRTVPGRTRYWIDADGHLRRFSAHLGGGTDWLVATLSA